MGPRKNPAQLPRIHEDICVDPLIENVTIRASRAVVAEAKRQKRFEEQCRVAEAQAMERGRSQLNELGRASLHASLVVERQLKRMAERQERKEKNAHAVDQLEVAVHLGNVPATAPPPLVRQAEKAARRSRTHLTEADHKEIISLYRDLTQQKVANLMGISKTSVNRHLKNAPATVHKGRTKRLTETMIDAGARFMFLFKQATWQRCTVFLRKTFDVKVSVNTAREHIKRRCGFRHGDFRRFPRDRNTRETIEKRYEYATKGLRSEREMALYNAIYYDEMYLTKNTKSGAWTVVGWTPTVVEETPHENNGVHLSLLMAVSPDLGIIHWEILEGSVTGADVLTFFKALVTRYVTKWTNEQRKTRRPLIMDNVRTHHNKELVAYLTGDVLAQLFVMEYLPPYSPFLNPIEEVFGYVKRVLWKRRAEDTKTDEDRQFLKKRLIDVVLQIDAEKIKAFYFHVVEFLKYARERTPVFTQQLYESSHVGDEVGACPILPEAVEALLNSYLPHVYEEFTAHQQALVETQYGAKRLTLAFVEDVIVPASRAAEAAGASEDGAAGTLEIA